MSLNSPTLSQRKLNLPSLRVTFNSRILKMNKSVSKNCFKPKIKHLKTFSTDKILPSINSEIELINHLTIDENPLQNIFNSSIRIIKEKEEIDNNKEVNNKRIGINFETEKKLTKEQQQEEIRSNQSREFFIRYEMMKNEKIMEDEILYLKKEVEKLKKEKDDISQKMIYTLKQIHNDEMEISFLNSDEFFHKLISERLENHFIHIEERKSQFSITPSKKSFQKKKSKKDNNDTFYLKTLQLKEQTTRNNKKKEVEETLKLNLEKLKMYKLDLEKLKEEYKKKKIILDSKIKYLSDYYHKKLYEGIDIRNEGLIWIMKAIWNLDQEIILSYFPTFLDQISIDYLFEVAHRSVIINKIKNEIQNYRKELDIQFEIINKQNKFDNQRTLFRTSIQGKLNSKSLPKIKLNQIQIAEKNINQSNVTIKNIGSVLNEKNPYSKILQNPIIQKISDLAAQSSEIEYEIIQMKRKELNRLFKEFFINDYQNKFHVVIETVIGALVGENKRDHEMVKYAKMKKDYFDNIRYIQYYTLNEGRTQIKENSKNNNS